jgi:hypothetical protein
MSQLAMDAQVIAAGLTATLPALAGIAGISATTRVALQSYLSDVQSAASAIVATTAGAAPVSAVQMLVRAVNAAVAVITSAPVNALIPASIEAVFVAASALLPGIEAAAGLLAAADAPGKMPPDTARLILKAAAGG